MVKRHADGALAACTSSCLDVLPCQQTQQRAAEQSVLGSIENLPAATQLEAARFTSNKKQCRLGVDQGPKPVDVSSLFAQARAVLRQPSSTVSEAPIGREQEYAQLTEVFEDFSSSGAGSSIYVSGLPGTGKSHTVRKCLSNLLLNGCMQQQDCNPCPVLITWINCMSVSSAGEIYAQVAATAQTGCSSSDWQQQQQCQQQRNEGDTDEGSAPDMQQRQRLCLSFPELLDCLHQQQHSAPLHAKQPNSSRTHSAATKRYRAARPSLQSNSDPHSTHGKASNSSSSSSVSTPQRHIIVLDEVDNIARKSLSDLVQLFKLPHEAGVEVLVVGIANSIDLTERTLPDLKLQLVTPRLITFNAYTSRQLATILESVVQQLPCKLFEASALQLCSRSVGASSGDLRNALKACRAAIDELEQQQTPASTSTEPVVDTAMPSPVATVGPRQMSAALSRLAGVRSSQFGAQAASIIRALPNQQQLLLYALAVICQQPAAQDAAAVDPVTPQKGGKTAASSLWKGAGTAAVLSSSGSGGSSPSSAAGWSQSGMKKKKATGGSSLGRLGGSSSAQACSPQSSVFVLAVGADAAYKQYTRVCQLLKLPPCTKGELLHMADLMAQMALLDIIRTPGAAAGGASSAAAGGSKSAAGLKGGAVGGGLRGMRGGSKLGGLGGGGRGLLGGGLGSRGGGAGGLGGSPLSAGAAGGQSGDVKLSLRASSTEVFAALKHNPALRCLVDA